jgi:hypothetical protein
MLVDKSSDFGFFLIPWLEEFDRNPGDLFSLRPGEGKEVVFRFIKVIVPPGTESRLELIGIDRVPGQPLGNALLNAPDFLSQDLQSGPVIFVQDGKIVHPNSSSTPSGRCGPRENSGER